VSAPASFRNPVLGRGVGTDHGDPFVIRYLDEFFLFHTGETSGRRGVAVHRSVDLVHWEFAGYALEAADTGWAWADLWAPEVVYERGTFYMYFAARSRDAPRLPPGDEGEAGRRLGLARATSPLALVADPEPLVGEWSIDGHPFRDDDGLLWLFYNVRFDGGPWPSEQPGTGTVCDRLLAPDTLQGRPTPVTFPDQPWEQMPGGGWAWNEAPYVLKRRGSYFQMYSGGWFADASYAVGIAQATSPRGPWRKHADNPILRSGDDILGPGHHSVVHGPNAATRYAVYHAHVRDEQGRKVHLDRLLWAGDRPTIAGPTSAAQPAPPAACLDERIPHWRAEAWARGTWVEVCGNAYPLPGGDAWHQVEAVRGDGRIVVRTGGVLIASRPIADPGPPTFAADGDVTAPTATSYLDDEGVHHLPAGSAYAWQWGGGERLELSLAIRGHALLTLDEATYELDGDDRAFRLVRLEHDGPVDEIVAHAPSGATVADLTVTAVA
jgi:GH43 family beta-xylosidase